MAFAKSYTTKQGETAKVFRERAGKYVAKLRKEAGLTQIELAKAVGFDYYTMVSQIETGLSRVPPDRYKDFAAALKVDPKEFVGELMRYYDPYTHAVLFGSRPKLV